MTTVLGILVGFYAGLACHDVGKLSDEAVRGMTAAIRMNGLAVPELSHVHGVAKAIVAAKGEPPAEVCHNLDKSYGGKGT